MFEIHEMRDENISVNNINLHIKTAGDINNDVIIFLHGFPEFWYGWKNQIPFFVENDYYVVVPDLRGYNLSSKPKRVKDYVVEESTLDIALLIQKLNKKKVILVGHDWGGVVAWRLAMEYPELIQKLILLNIPHPQVVLQYIKTHPVQMLKSSYIAFFQLPILPELILRLFDFKLLELALNITSKEGTFSKEDMNVYKLAWRQPGTLKYMLNWYRALKYSKLDRTKEVQSPTLLIWGKKDKFLSYEMARLSIKKCKNGTLKVIDDATHWLHHENPEEINELIFKFIIIA